MVEEHATERLIRDFHVAQNRFYAGGEQEPVVAMLAPDVVWHVPGGSALAGDHVGRDEVLRYFTRRRRLSFATLRIMVRCVLAVDEHAVVLADGELQRGGETVGWEIVGIFRVARGTIAECWVLPVDQEAYDQIWAPARSAAAGGVSASPPQSEHAS
jgi:hypothetical protein